MSWPNLTDLIVDKDSDAPIGLVGAPLAAGSVTPGRCDLAPAVLRATLKRIGRYDVETRRELASLIADHGDVALGGMTIEQATAPIRDACSASVARHALTLLVGGNNAVTRPGVQSLGLPLDKVGLITLDAHFDLRDLDAGLSNGNPVRALLEDGLPGSNIQQIGIAPFANTRKMDEDADAEGINVMNISDCFGMGIDWCIQTAIDFLAHVDAIYVDCDIDVIDRCQFPGAPGARPGGMTASMFFAATRMLAACPKVRLIDLTEWDPPLDPSDLSALTAGRWVAECLAGFETR
ncbi:MAG: arginase family protein [Sphingomonas bacterium]|nr:arginase family protein [Sphingomonas bacterium]